MATTRINGRNGGRFAEDPELLFWENNIALAGFIRTGVEKIIELTDDNDVLRAALVIDRHAQTIQERTRNHYRAKRKEQV